MIRIAASADNHITERETVAGRIILGPDGRNIRGKDRERCLNAVIDGAIDRGVDLLIDAGDLFDSSRPTPSEYVIVERALDRACKHFPVVCVGCNHGLPQSTLEQHALAPLEGRNLDLHICLLPDVRFIATASGTIQVASLPWPRRSILATDEECARLSPEGLNALISEKLKGVVRMLLTNRADGIPTVLAGHVTLREAVFGSGRGPDTGAILLSADDLEPFAAAILGDIHKTQAFSRDGRIFYTGSTDRLDFGEERNIPGWWLVTLDGDRFSKEFVPTPARRFRTFSPDELDRTPWDPDVIYRVQGEVSQAQYDQMQPLLTHWRANPIFSEELEVTRTTRVRSEAMGKSLTDEEALREWCTVNGREGEYAGLLEEHRTLATK